MVRSNIVMLRDEPSIGHNYIGHDHKDHDVSGRAVEDSQGPLVAIKKISVDIFRHVWDDLLPARHLQEPYHLQSSVSHRIASPHTAPHRITRTRGNRTHILVMAH